jgi:hypothetical protein
MAVELAKDPQDFTMLQASQIMDFREFFQERMTQKIDLAYEISGLGAFQLAQLTPPVTIY